MEIEMKREGTTLSVDIIGRLDTLTSPELEKKLEPALDGVKEVVFNLKDLAYISSSGLRVLLAVAKVMEQNQGTVKVTEPNESVMEVFELTGFDTVFNIG